MIVLLWVAIAVKIHHDQSNPHKEQSLIGTGLQFWGFSPLFFWEEKWPHPGQPGPEEESKISTF